jgi:hypothetical protein
MATSVMYPNTSLPAPHNLAHTLEAPVFNKPRLQLNLTNLPTQESNEWTPSSARDRYTLVRDRDVRLSGMATDLPNTARL